MKTSCLVLVYFSRGVSSSSNMCIVSHFRKRKTFFNFNKEYARKSFLLLSCFVDVLDPLLADRLVIKHFHPERSKMNRRSLPRNICKKSLPVVLPGLVFLPCLVGSSLVSRFRLVFSCVGLSSWLALQRQEKTENGSREDTCERFSTQCSFRREETEQPPRSLQSQVLGVVG